VQRFVQTAIVIGTVAAGALFATAGAANAAIPGELNLNLAIDCPDLSPHWQAGPDECVQALQDLNLMGASLGEDGFFGPQTQGAVMRFLSGFGLNPTGVADVYPTGQRSFALRSPAVVSRSRSTGVVQPVRRGLPV
jgi:peptidoglycan hydrolase-like protein with peptidoglycan-binding domain